MRPATRTWRAVVIVGCVLAGAAYALTRPGKGQGGKTSGGASAAPGPRATPVVIALARAGDLPVSLTALGSVTALNTVTVRSRVDGQLLKTLFIEGELVRQGELLAEIDPSPSQAQLTQAERQLAHDMADLPNAPSHASGASPPAPARARGAARPAAGGGVGVAAGGPGAGGQAGGTPAGSDAPPPRPRPPPSGGALPHPVPGRAGRVFPRMAFGAR